MGGPYSLDGDVVTAGPLVTTRMAGPPEATEQEHRLLDLLAGPLRAVAGVARRISLVSPGSGSLVLELRTVAE